MSHQRASDLLSKSLKSETKEYPYSDEVTFLILENRHLGCTMFRKHDANVPKTGASTSFGISMRLPD